MTLQIPFLDLKSTYNELKEELDTAYWHVMTEENITSVSVSLNKAPGL